MHILQAWLADIKDGRQCSPDLSLVPGFIGNKASPWLGYGTGQSALPDADGLHSYPPGHHTRKMMGLGLP
jgi:hypothetical protein